MLKPTCRPYGALKNKQTLFLPICRPYGTQPYCEILKYIS